jgi:hypothetical protein
MQIVRKKTISNIYLYSLILVLGAVLITFTGNVASAQDVVRYTGEEMVNVDYHHGALRPAIGVHNIQVMRANRENPHMADGYGWTYNHAPNMAYWNKQFLVQYLSDPVGEHMPPSQSYLVRSDNGEDWGKPEVIFPIYAIPDGTIKEGRSDVAKDLFAVMHQRMSFYVATDNRMLALGYYGLCLDKRDSPNDGNGIGRVVREIYRDGTFGPVFFIRYNHGWGINNTSFPFYQSAPDAGFVSACNELLKDPLMMQQWNEEADRDDPLIPMTSQFKAFCHYALPDGRIVGFWKHALSAISDDGGKSWPRPLRAFGFVNSNAKFWAQQTADKRYATVYNPSELRWPLALSVSDDGLEFRRLLLVNGEISPMRYGGNYKSYGPQYPRGIVAHNGRPEDGKMWVTYSMNKEDIWVSSIPVPVNDVVEKDVREDFSKMKEGTELASWNVFSPVWARVLIESYGKERVMALHDKDPYDYAVAERVVAASEKMMVEFTIVPGQSNHGQLEVELTNGEGMGAIRLIFNKDGGLMVKNGYRNNKLMDYEAGVAYEIRLEIDVTTRFYDVYVNGQKKTTRLIYRPVSLIERVTFRTGSIRRFPDVDTPTDQDYDLTNPCPGTPLEEAVFYLKSFKTKKL